MCVYVFVCVYMRIYLIIIYTFKKNKKNTLIIIILCIYYKS